VHNPGSRRGALEVSMPHGSAGSAAARTKSKHVVDEDAVDLTLSALALLGRSATALELSRAIRDHFGATASPSRIYVAIGQLWERGLVTVQPMRVRRGERSTRQTVVTITPRGRASAASRLEAITEDEDAARSAASKVAPDLSRRPR
jgi:DNA-binding PadR family transcriptional regulator